MKSLETISYLTINEKRSIASKMTGVEIIPYNHENADKILLNSLVNTLEDLNLEFLDKEDVNNED